MLRFVLFPVFENETDLTLNLLQAAYYLGPKLKAGATVVYGALEHWEPQSAPAFFDPLTRTYFDRYRARFLQTDLAALGHDGGPDTVVLCWNTDKLAEARAFARQVGGQDAQVIRIDRQKEQFAASFLLKLTSNDGLGDEAQISENKARLDKLLERMSDRDTAIFGTGPSLESISLDSMTDRNVIVTNSMVKRYNTIKKVNPVAIVASDPIFHAGCSMYAAKFRKMLIRAMDATDAYFIHPMRDVGVYQHVLPPRLQDRLVAVPLLPAAQPNFDLQDSFWVRSTPNVMTLMLIPLAASVSNRVYMAGFDGRPRENNEYFWNHSSKDQITEEMESIREAHPSFFLVSYRDYYENHLNDVKCYLDNGSDEGIDFISLTRSHIPAVDARYQSDPVAPGEDTPEISIIVPCHNASDTINETLQSILNQSHHDFEVIAIDDGSTDDTQTKLRYWSQLDPRIRLLSQDNMGVSAARNRGLEAARGRYITFCDADDLLMPGSLSTRLKVLKEAPTDAVYGKWTIIDENGAPLGIESQTRKEWPFQEMAQCSIHVNTVMARGSILKAERFQLGMRNGEDWLFIARLARKGVRFRPAEGVHLNYRWRKGSATQANMLRHILALFDVYAELMADKPLDLDLPAENRCGIPANKVYKEQFSRLYQGAAEAVLRGDQENAEQILRLIEHKSSSVDTQPRRIDAVFVERQAVRLFLKPLGSDDLRNEIGKRKASILSQLGAFEESALHSSFVQAFKELLEEQKQPGEARQTKSNAGTKEAKRQLAHAPSSHPRATAAPASTGSAQTPSSPAQPPNAGIQDSVKAPTSTIERATISLSEQKPEGKTHGLPGKQTAHAAPSYDTTPGRRWRPRKRTFLILSIAALSAAASFSAALLTPSEWTIAIAGVVLGAIAGYGLQVLRQLAATSHAG
jgi:glycosyltransferase involved in cell wall biosynthesis